MKRTIPHKMLLAVIAVMQASAIHAQLVKCTISATSYDDVQMAYAFDGDILNMEYKSVTPDENGTFTFDADMPVPEADINIYVDTYIFGVHVERGKTAEVYIEDDADGRLKARFEGDGKDKSEFFNAYSEAFDIMKYFSPDPSESLTTQEYRDRLESEYASLKEKLPCVEDASCRDYYARLSEGMYTWTKIRIIMDQAFDEHKKFKDYPEYNEAIATIDPNDPMSLKCNLTVAWMGAQQKLESAAGSDMSAYSMESIDVVERSITDPLVRRSLTNYIGYSFFTFGSGGDVMAFWERYKEFAKDYPDIIARYESKVGALTKTRQGQEPPYVPVLTSADGSTISLESLYGKLLYIDVWATWCVPCCKEIPYLEKLVEKYSGNDRVQFISISIDQNQEAWKKKIGADAPAWPQYILSAEEQRQFMTAWGISGIPRFILLDKDGTIITSDAQRPSDEKLIDTIEANL